MAGIKSKKKTVTSQITSTQKSSGIINYIRFSESYTSLILGIVVVIIASFLFISFINNKKNTTPPPPPEISSTKIEPEIKTVAKAGSSYLVREGDSLWSIAQEVYNDGYKWTEIAKANNLSHPDEIQTRMTLKLPEIKESAQKEVTITPAATAGKGTVGTTYTVLHGDTLWSIAQKKYGNPYRWVDIAKANNLVNPDVIHSENILQLPN